MNSLAPARPRHWFFHIPVLGWIARDLVHGPEDTIWYELTILLTLLVLAVKSWGLVALAMTALALVPAMFVILIMITLGK
ncbi:MAG: hypothetical protein ORN49_10015 [Rhodobacteraceae bacterium]|nr:hypothetical protein [Paracoccaceae bacterium]